MTINLLKEAAEVLNEVLGFWESNEKVHDGTAQLIQAVVSRLEDKIEDEKPGEKRRCILCKHQYKGDITCPACRYNMGRPLVSVYDLPD